MGMGTSLGDAVHDIVAYLPGTLAPMQFPAVTAQLGYFSPSFLI